MNIGREQCPWIGSKKFKEKPERRESGGDLKVRVKTVRSLIIDFQIAIRSNSNTEKKFRDLGC